MEIISKNSSIGLNVMAITSDMGSSRYSNTVEILENIEIQVSNYIPHPLDNNRSS